MSVSSDSFQCSGSLDPAVVRHAFHRLLPVWQSIDLAESNRLEDAAGAAKRPETVQPLAQKIQAAWPIKGSELAASGYSLKMGFLSTKNVLPFLRFVEELLLEQRLAPVMAYWSRHNSARLLPNGNTYRALLRDSLCVSIFSEDRSDPPDEWCFWMETSQLCLIIYGQQCEDKGKFSEGVDPRFLDGGNPPQDAGVPRRPFPHPGDTDISLPEPESNQEID